MKVLENTLSVLVETWDDPGDYPNSLAAGPLPSYDYAAGLEGEVRLALEAKDIQALADTDDYDALFAEWVNQEVELPAGVIGVTCWESVVVVTDTNGIELVLTKEESSDDIVWDENYNPNEPDECERWNFENWFGFLKP